MSATTFEYHAPTTLQEALTLLTRYGGEAKILAGGHSLLPIMNLRLAQPHALIDIGKIPGLSGIREENGTIVIGPMTTHYMVESSSLLKQKVPLLPETAALIGDVQIRNRGTIGGSIAHADPAGDLPAAAVALDLQLKVVGPRGERTLSSRGFFVDILTTALQPDEILTEILCRPLRRALAAPTRNSQSSVALCHRRRCRRCDGGRQRRVPEGQRRLEWYHWETGGGGGGRAGPRRQAPH